MAQACSAGVLPYRLHSWVWSGWAGPMVGLVLQLVTFVLRAVVCRPIWGMLIPYPQPNSQ